MFGKAPQTIGVCEAYVKEDDEWKVACQETTDAAIEKTKKDKIELLAKRDVRATDKS